MAEILPSDKQVSCYIAGISAIHNIARSAEISPIIIIIIEECSG